MCSTVLLNAVDSSHQDATESDQEDGECESLWTTPDIHDLCVWQLEESCDQECDHAGESSEGVSFVEGGDVWCEGSDNTIAEGEDEFDTPDAVGCQC